METNVIYCGDNLEVLPKYIDSDSVDLIYIDPPFNTNRKYEVFWGEAVERRAFDDRYGNAMVYLDWMRPRLAQLYRVLKSTGSFYYHCDWHASHYLKVELDRIFGFDNFRNEIVWSYRRWPVKMSAYQRMHDTVLFYTKSGHYTFNTVFEPASESFLKRFKGSGNRLDPGETRKRATGKPTPGMPLRDVWDISIVAGSSKERLGYPTQKPLALLEQVIKGSSDEAQIVLDAFCGCGTTLEAAAKLKRRWIGIDFSPTACRVMVKRLQDRLGLKEGVDFTVKDLPKTEEELRRMPHFEFQNWAVIALGGVPQHVKVHDYGIDGWLYPADEPRAKPSRDDMFAAHYYPIQVKQQDRAGRPDIDKFETAMRREKRVRGYFVAFGFSADAIREIRRANRQDGLDIRPITVKELLEYERRVGT
jgi:DNA modification methylase